MQFTRGAKIISTRSPDTVVKSVSKMFPRGGGRIGIVTEKHRDGFIGS